MANLTCEYLQDDQRCKAISKNTEGLAIRKESCSRDAWDYCCYFCEYQGSCGISCSFKGKPETVPQSPNVDMTISRVRARCQERMEELANLFADGKIGEQAYATAARTIEKRLARINQAKGNPNAAFSVSEPFSAKSAEFGIDANEKPTTLWYLVPFFFGIIGGLVGYVGTKDEDEDMANGLLFFGIVWTVVLTIFYYALITALLSRFPR